MADPEPRPPGRYNFMVAKDDCEKCKGTGRHVEWPVGGVFSVNQVCDCVRAYGDTWVQSDDPRADVEVLKADSPADTVENEIHRIFGNSVHSIDVELDINASPVYTVRLAEGSALWTELRDVQAIRDTGVQVIVKE